MTPHWKLVHEARVKLNAEYAGLFDLDRPKPFKFGFRNELLARHPEITKRVIQTLMWWLTHRRAYFVACAADAPRFGFDGPDGKVSDAAARHAAEQFEARNSTAKDRWIDRAKPSGEARA